MRSTLFASPMHAGRLPIVTEISCGCSLSHPITMLPMAGNELQKQRNKGKQTGLSFCFCRNCPLTHVDKAANRRKSSVRSKVEHYFLTLKRLWEFAKVRYRSLAKNTNRAFAMLAMLNINPWEQALTGEVRPA